MSYRRNHLGAVTIAAPAMSTSVAAKNLVLQTPISPQECDRRVLASAAAATELMKASFIKQLTDSDRLLQAETARLLGEARAFPVGSGERRTRGELALQALGKRYALLDMAKLNGASWTKPSGALWAEAINYARGA